MTKYFKARVTRQIEGELIVSAETEEEARSKFYAGDFQIQDSGEELIGFTDKFDGKEIKLEAVETLTEQPLKYIKVILSLPEEAIINAFNLIKEKEKSGNKDKSSLAMGFEVDADQIGIKSADNMTEPFARMRRGDSISFNVMGDVTSVVDMPDKGAMS